MPDTICVALIGLGGAIIGSISTISVRCLDYYLRLHKEEKEKKPRKDILKKMLENGKDDWRKLDTLMHTIGANEEVTKKLLIEVGARASETGKPVWALISKQPLPTSDGDESSDKVD